MTRRFALMLDPVPATDVREDFSDTIAEIDPSTPALSVADLASTRGDGIFESIGVVDSHPQDVTAHLTRLAHSAGLCDLPEPHLGQWRQAAERAAAGCGRGESVIRLILSRGLEPGPSPTAWITVGPAPDQSAARRDGVRVVTLDRGFDVAAAARAPWLLLGAKTLSYAVNMAAIREARRRGADDAVFVTSDGLLLEGPTASVVLRVGDRFVTPEPADGILHGTTQLSLFAHLETQGARTEYRRLAAAELAGADAAWLLSSVRLAAPIRAVDGVPLTVDHGRTDDWNAHLLSPRD